MKKLVTGLVMFSLIVSGCSLFGPKDEKQAFIDATIKASCLVFGAENVNDPELEKQVNDVFKEFGFDPENEEAMNAIADKYKDDEEVSQQILAGVQECGKDFFDQLSSGATEEAATEEAPADATKTEAKVAQ